MLRHYNLNMAKYNWFMVAMATLLLAQPASAQWDGWDYDFDREVKPWTELQSQIPSPPVEKNLIPFKLNGVSSHQGFVDAESISVGSDGVVRYTLVIKTSRGAINTSFEGIRCDTVEHKYYALGHSDGTWARARNPQWRKILITTSNDFHRTLYREYLCDSKSVAGTAPRIVQSLRRGGR